MSLRPTLCLSCLLSLLSLLVAAPQLGAAEPACEIRISGDQTLTIHQEQKAADGGAAPQEASNAARTGPGSDYWLSDQELQTALESLIASEEVTRKLSPEELRQRVKERMKGDPRLSPLTVACGDMTATVTLMASPSSKYASVPQKPGKYRITRAKGSRPGDFNLAFTASHAQFEVSTPGTLELTRFDARGVAGRYWFQATRSSGGDPGVKRLKVTGSFSFRCASGARCQR